MIVFPPLQNPVRSKPFAHCFPFRTSTQVPEYFFPLLLAVHFFAARFSSDISEGERGSKSKSGKATASASASASASGEGLATGFAATRARNRARRVMRVRNFMVVASSCESVPNKC